MSKITTYEELCAINIGEDVHKVEKNDVMRYVICCHHPNPNSENVLLSYGTGDGCSIWVNRHNLSSLYTTRKEAVEQLIADIEKDLEAVKRLYK